VHHYCFSCGYHLPSNRIIQYQTRNKVVSSTEDVKQPREILTLPSDSDRIISPIAKRWLAQYDCNEHTLAKHTILWSDYKQMLIFPYFITGELVGWQGRYFGLDEKHPKWYTKGKVDQFIYTLGKPSDTIVLVEDIVSAIVVSRQQMVSPIFGSVISFKRFLALSHFHSQVIIWLDPDKQKESLSYARKGRLLGLDCKVILSTKDPKEHTQEEIRHYLNDSTRGSTS